eukprot:4100436-Prymnesium_polylepis.1
MQSDTNRTPTGHHRTPPDIPDNRTPTAQLGSAPVRRAPPAWALFFSTVLSFRDLYTATLHHDRHRPSERGSCGPCAASLAGAHVHVQPCTMCHIDVCTSRAGLARRPPPTCACARLSLIHI